PGRRRPGLGRPPGPVRPHGGGRGGMSPRERFLGRVRDAVREGNALAGSPPLPDRGAVGYQGAGSDPVGRFRDELAAAGGRLYLVADAAEAARAAVRLAVEKGARRAVVGGGPFIDSLGLQKSLSEMGIECRPAELTGADQREAFFAADVGITGVDALVA